jgi:ABC-type xylose transport system substrate-binding protein
LALSDPQSIKIGASTISLPRTSTESAKSEYTSNDGLTKLTLSTTSGKRKRQVVRVDVNKIAADPFIPAQNAELSMSFYMVFDRPNVGYTNAEALAAAVGLIEAATASEDSMLKKLLGSES